MKSRGAQWRARVLRELWLCLLLVTLLKLLLAFLWASVEAAAVGCALGTLLVVCAPAVWRRRPRECSAEMESLVATTVGAEVAVDGASSTERLGKYTPMQKHAQYWALKVRERFGIVADKAADLAAVRRWVADEMLKDETHPWKDMRIHDRVFLQTLVTRLSVVPTPFEVEVEHMVRGALASDLRSQFQAAQK